MDIMNEINQPAAIRAGGIMAVVNIVIGIAIAIFPPLVCLICWFTPLLGLATGVLYDIFAAQRGTVITPRSGAIGGAAAGLIVGVAGIISNILYAVIQSDFSTVGGGLVSALVGGALVGAIGGAVYAAITNRGSGTTTPPPAM